jgi:hypothetical protein
LVAEWQKFNAPDDRIPLMEAKDPQCPTASWVSVESAEDDDVAREATGRGSRWTFAIEA